MSNYLSRVAFLNKFFQLLHASNLLSVSFLLDMPEYFEPPLKVMKIKHLKPMLFFLGAAGVSIFLLLFIMTGIWIGYGVKSQCQEAKREYGGNCVEALISVLNDKDKSFRARNSAIWALGQLGDKRALPVLQGYYTGVIPNREPLDKSISQYELKKAINLTSGGLNITAFIWRNSITGN